MADDLIDEFVVEHAEFAIDSGRFATMKPFLDTNVIVAAVTRDTERSETAVRVLNDVDETYTSVLNLMELRTVLTKKKQFERDRVERIEQRVSSRTTVTFPDASDMMTANQLQDETLRYPMDALVLAAADAVDATLLSFDGELRDHGAKRPQDLV
ncbi:PilT protein domain-containing protein [Natronolimnohabitans innermongolicus JCM 12255]|uniref:Ribonuclease VapC n=2 Tax=Natronolimnohabitans innermongolicus TaxID=253107 RepID=L9WQJ4_9EURY|nr:PIN domain-containing protein [Natronolimnohabitans innermongolicus]ELY51662.1 PilT protein domain-containing protein [Natronolimnohabitans innermongolicus JCM 12255]